MDRIINTLRKGLPAGLEELAQLVCVINSLWAG